ncbi:MAG: S41 family peptidase [Vicinamibacterales bacterium]
MAVSKKRRSKKSDAERLSSVKGAVPYKPKMTKSEVLEEIGKVSGTSTTLGELRDTLPTAHVGRPATGARAAGRRTRGRIASRTSRDPAAAVAALTIEDRLVLIDQAMLMLQEIYAHLPLKRALHAVDPIQRLQQLRLRHNALDEREFQSEILDIFLSLRDLHTNYTLPAAYWPIFAFLPFRVEEYYAEGDRKYLVSWVSPQNPDPKLKAGVEITHWNGSPIDLAIARNAAREAGSNAEARRARGLEALTLRWFGSSLPPDEDWVTLTYQDGTNVAESRHDWQVVTRDDLMRLLAPAGDDPTGIAQAGLGIDIKTELLRQVRKALFDAPALRVEAEMARHRARSAEPPRADVSIMPDVYPRWGQVATPSGVFGYIRLATFAPPDRNVDGAVNEFVRILRTLPNSGLILDVRGNGGGYITFGERILQTMTPRRITPEPFHFVTTAFTLRLAQSVDWLKEWAEPLAMALGTGAGFSQGFPLSDPLSCNDIGQVYQGPIVLITDAFCYSTTDIFAAGFQDHEIGTILGCHNNTGAGGANVWDHAGLLQQLEVSPNPFVPLPGGASMRVAVRRSTRVGTRSGVPVEDLGVVPDERYFMTRADLLEHNVDLITHAAKTLAGQLSFPLEVAVVGRAPASKLRITSRNIDRVDLLVNDRPLLSGDLSAGSAEIALPKALAAGSRIVAQGYRKGALVSSSRLTV